MTCVSIILPTKNVEETLGGLLSSIYCQKFSGEIETFVLDSSCDGTAEIAKGFPVEVFHIEEEDYNYGGTRNFGASLAKGEYLIFLSADVVIADTEWLLKVLSPFSDAKVAGVFGRQSPKEGASPMERFFINSVYPSESYLLAPDAQGQVHLGGRLLFSNTNAAIRRDVWQEIKLPVMLMSEDQEWAKRALVAGYKIAYASEAVVYHSHTYSLRQVFQRFFDSGATLPYVYRHEKLVLPRGGLLLEGIKYLTAEGRYLIRHGGVKGLPYALVYEFMRFLGYFLGMHQKSLPMWLKVKLCHKKNHWQRYDSILVHGEDSENGG